MPLSQRSENNLKDVHPDLQLVIRTAIRRIDEGTPPGTVPALDCVVTEGKRTPQRQKQLKALGFSQTLDSEHLPNEQGFSQAVDIAALVHGTVSWKAGFYAELAKIIKQAAKEVEVPITWGGDWKFKDLVHFQLDKKHYPRKAYPRA